jgi:hypothetical protein
MAITQAMATSFKVGILDGIFDFSSGTSQVFKIALYTSAATLGAGSVAYSVTNEVSGTGYTAGGNTLTISAKSLLLQWHYSVLRLCGYYMVYSYYYGSWRVDLLGKRRH